MNGHLWTSVCRLLCIQRWCLAFIESAAAIFVFGCIIGARYLPYEYERLNEQPDQRVIYCSPLADNRGVVACIRSATTYGKGDVHERWTYRTYIVSDQVQAQKIVLPNDLQCLSMHESRVFVADSFGRLKVFWIGKEESKQLGNVLKGRAVSMSCSPDGRTLLVLDSCSLSAWNVDMTSTKCLAPRWARIDATIECFAFYQDSQSGIYNRVNDGQSVLTEFDCESGRFKDVVLAAGQPTKMTLSRDGHFLAVVQVTGGIDLFERSSVDKQWVRRTVPGLCAGPTPIATFSSDSGSLITSSSDGCGLLKWELVANGQPVAFCRLVHKIMGCECLCDEKVITWGANNKLSFTNLKSTFPASEIEL